MKMAMPNAYKEIKEQGITDLVVFYMVVKALYQSLALEEIMEAVMEMIRALIWRTWKPST